MRNSERGASGPFLLLVVALLLGGWVLHRLIIYESLGPLDEGFAILKAGKAEDFQLAFVRIEPYARSGNKEAQEWLGEMYAFGEGVPVDEIRARMWFRRAQGTGSRLPGSNEYYVSLHFLEGDGPAKRQDKIAALRWMQYAAETGYSEAQKFLADRSRLTAKGLVVEPSVSEYWSGVVREMQAESQRYGRKKGFFDWVCNSN